MSNRSYEDRYIDPLILTYVQKNQWIEKITNRFSTYGFSQVSTTTFAAYESYMHLQENVKTNELVKMIDHGGNILTLRSDATIPITKRLLQEPYEQMNERRYFYVLDVFRYTKDSNRPHENTQAGVECFGANGLETDTEIIALAMHTLQDLHCTSFTLEVGHAGFFQRCMDVLELDVEQQYTFKQLVQTKNIGELKHYVSQTSGTSEWKELIASIPLLYGDPIEIIRLVQSKINDPIILEQMDHLEKIYQLLNAYHLAEHMVIDLSLMNHMDYYSDIIFQGFMHEVGKPVLMGGRYNELTKQFGASIPAIGFACDVDAILSSKERKDSHMPQIDICIIQEEGYPYESLSLSTLLRSCGFSARVIEKGQKKVPAKIICDITQDKNGVVYRMTTGEKTIICTTKDGVKENIQSLLSKEI